MIIKENYFKPENFTESADDSLDDHNETSFPRIFALITTCVIFTIIIFSSSNEQGFSRSLESHEYNVIPKVLCL
eukprot:UN08358